MHCNQHNGKRGLTHPQASLHKRRANTVRRTRSTPLATNERLAAAAAAAAAATTAAATAATITTTTTTITTAHQCQGSANPVAHQQQQEKQLSVTIPSLKPQGPVKHQNSTASGSKRRHNYSYNCFPTCRIQGIHVSMSSFRSWTKRTMPSAVYTRHQTRWQGTHRSVDDWP